VVVMIRGTFLNGNPLLSQIFYSTTNFNSRHSPNLRPHPNIQIRSPTKYPSPSYPSQKPCDHYKWISDHDRHGTMGLAVLNVLNIFGWFVHSS